MDVEALIWFAMVEQNGSFRAAAARLKQPGSTVSRRIAKLETDLGYPLLTRTTRALALTEEGEELLPYARRLLETQQQIVEWQEDRRAEPTGRLRLTAPGSFARGPLTPWLANYRQAHPKVAIELIHSNDYLDFQQHRLDFAFRQGPLPDSRLIARRLFGIQYGVYVSPDWLASHPPINTPEDVLANPVITTGVQGRSLPWRFAAQNLTPKHIDMLFDDMTQCLVAAAKGLGPTYASRFEASAYLTDGTLVEVLQDHRTAPADFYLVWPNRPRQSLKNASFMAHIQQEIADFGEQDGLIF